LDHTLRLGGQGDGALEEALEVMREAFSGMKGRVNPPSSIHTLTLDGLTEISAEAEVWVAGDPVIGTVILTQKGSVLYVGKLAVREQKAGVGRALMDLAERRARELGLGWLELQSRVELLEIHAVFKAMGFVEVIRTTHEGFTRPTSITFRKVVDAYA